MFVHQHTESMDGCKLDHRQSLPRSAHESSAAALVSKTLPLAAAESEAPPLHSYKTKPRCSQYQSLQKVMDSYGIKAK